MDSEHYVIVTAESLSETQRIALCALADSDARLDASLPEAELIGKVRLHAQALVGVRLPDGTRWVDPDVEVRVYDRDGEAVAKIIHHAPPLRIPQQVGCCVLLEHGGAASPMRLQRMRDANPGVDVTTLGEAKGRVLDKP